MHPVKLVGAGPGAVDLMTVRAINAVSNADVLLYDALVCEEALAMAPAKCLRIRTGKRAGKASMAQDTINRLMLRLARRDLHVVRLKGGDPSVFGRCGEERAFLEAHGVEVEVVPGVTAASAAAAQFGFPLTHRGQARRLMLATARTLDGSVADVTADEETTLVLYMAGEAAGDVSAQLLAQGRSPGTPALAVANAGRPEARLVRCDLGSLGGSVGDAGFEGPVLILVGDVASHARKLGADPLPHSLPLARACP